MRWLQNILDVAKTESDLPRVPRPHLVMRLYNDNFMAGQPYNGKAFMTQQWCYNLMDPITGPFRKLIFRCANECTEWRTRSILLPLGDGISIRIAQMLPDIETVGDVGMVLYIAGDDDSLSILSGTGLQGVFTRGLMDVLNHVAIRINAKIVSMHSTLNGSVVVMYQAHDKKFDLEEYFTRYYGGKEWIVDEGDDGTIHRPDQSASAG